MQLYAELAGMLKKGGNFLLATIVESSGPVPRGPGCSALFSGGKLLGGTLGGGTTEYGIQQKTAGAALLTSLQKAELTNSGPGSGEASCGGSLLLLLDASPARHLPVWQALRRDLLRQVSGLLVTLAETRNGELILTRKWLPQGSLPEAGRELPPWLMPALDDMDRGVTAAAFSAFRPPGDPSPTETRAFLERVSPPCQLVIAGAGHVGKALARLGKLLDFEVIVWDDRPDYAHQDNIPDAGRYIRCPAGMLSRHLKPGRNTYLVIATRGHHSDGEILRQFTGSPLAYTGMLGSRTKAAKMREEFLRHGWATPEQWERIRVPVGLEIGASTAEEIAVSIAAQLVLERNRRASIPREGDNQCRKD